MAQIIIAITRIVVLFLFFAVSGYEVLAIRSILPLLIHKRKLERGVRYFSSTGDGDLPVVHDAVALIGKITSMLTRYTRWFRNVAPAWILLGITVWMLYF